MKKCSIEGCENKHEAKGFCKKHYRAFKKYGDPLATLKRTSKGVAKPYEFNHKYIDNVEYKLCSGCNEWYPMTEEYYYKNKSSKDGLHPWCKKCSIEKAKAKTTEEKQKKRESNLKRYYNKKDFLLIQMKDYRKSNVEKWQDYYSGYQKREKVKSKFKIYNMNRNQHKDHDISEIEWAKCKEYFNYKCAYCDISEEESIKQYNQHLHKEHAINNGENDITNCLPACRSCNSKKWKRDFTEWYNESNPLYAKERFLKIINWLTKDCYKITI